MKALETQEMKEMKNKGFTLIELLGVLVLISIIWLSATCTDIFIFVFAFTFDSNKKGNNTYAFNENSLEKTSENEEPPKEDSDNAEVVQVENKPEEPQIVYDNMTLDELSDKLNRTLSSNLSGNIQFHRIWYQTERYRRCFC